MTYQKRFCPNCGSSDVEPDSRHTNVLGEMIFNDNKWLCNDCDYAGLMPEDSDESVEENNTKLEFDEKQQDMIDKEAGKASFMYVAYVLIPVTIFYILYLSLV